MNKAEALHTFWSSFGLKAYDENTIPTGDKLPQLPYITYSTQTDSIGNILALTGSIWYRSSSWKEVEQKAEEVAEKVGKSGYYLCRLDNGYLWITKGTPFSQRMSDPADDMIRRVYINLHGEFLTAY